MALPGRFQAARGRCVRRREASLNAVLPNNEAARLEALASYAVLDTAPERAFDDITQLATQICGTPIGLVSLVDGERQWFKSKVGIEAEQTSRDLAFCAHAILDERLMVVPDATEDERFAENPLVTQDPRIRFYAGAPLLNPEGHALGTLCVIDRVTRELTLEQKESLRALGRQVVAQLELRRKVAEQGRIIEGLAEAEQALRQANRGLTLANKELADFARIVSHDLKAPLRGIGSLTSWIASDFGERLGPDGRKHFDLLMGRVDLMHRLLDALLQYSRIGSLRERPTTIDCGSMVERIFEGMDVPAGIQLQIDGPLPRVTAQPIRLEQMFRQLIENAVNFMGRPEGWVKVTGEERETEWYFSVTDNGPGIEQRYFEKIFEIFQTLSPRDKQSRVGLGLALVKKVVEQSEGRVWVESVPGKGSNFQFTLPR